MRTTAERAAQKMPIPPVLDAGTGLFRDNPVISECVDGHKPKAVDRAFGLWKKRNALTGMGGLREEWES